MYNRRSVRQRGFTARYDARPGLTTCFGGKARSAGTAARRGAVGKLHYTVDLAVDTVHNDTVREAAQETPEVNRT